MYLENFIQRKIRKFYVYKIKPRISRHPRQDSKESEEACKHVKRNVVTLYSMTEHDKRVTIPTTRFERHNKLFVLIKGVGMYRT